MKIFYEMENVGKAKYLVNFTDGVKKHRDGSDFYDLCIFRNRKKKNAFVRELVLSGYAERGAQRQ